MGGILLSALLGGLWGLLCFNVFPSPTFWVPLIIGSTFIGLIVPRF